MKVSEKLVKAREEICIVPATLYISLQVEAPVSGSHQQAPWRVRGPSGGECPHLPLPGAQGGPAALTGARGDVNRAMGARPAKGARNPRQATVVGVVVPAPGAGWGVRVSSDVPGV